MGRLDKITYNGHRAAVVVGEEGIVSDGLGEDDERTVKAMCLYALEVTAGREPCPYSDERAIRYARRADEARR